MTPEVVLASQSPRRRELLGLLFEHFEVHACETDESLPDGIAPDKAVERLALQKAQAVAPAYPGRLVIGADTIVVLDGAILGKPRDEADAARMLGLLSGRCHAVHTGVALIRDGKTRRFSCRTAVHFAALSPKEIEWYVHTGEPMDKAGAYGIQGYGARFIEGIEGDYFNVMGLPVNRLYREIGEFTK